MHVVYDPQTDVAYIFLGHIIVDRVADTHVVDLQEVGGGINLDFDEDGHLLGLEVLHASRVLRREILRTAFWTH